MTVYRYAWKGLDLASLQALVRPDLILTRQGPAPAPVMDISAIDPTLEDKIDLDEAMLSLGWNYQSTDPPTQAQGLILRQEIGLPLTVDMITVSDVFEDLLTVPITTNASVLGLMANMVSTAAASLGYFRVTVDGFPVAKGAHLEGTANLFLGGRVPVPAGAHVVKVQWRVAPGGTQSIRPVTVPDAEFASLLVREMSG